MSYSEPSPEVEGANQPNAKPDEDASGASATPPKTEEPDGTPVENPSGG